ncbi:Glycosyl phosphatidyl inositol protein transamidase complex subunit [Thelotrema lepadinum]|nr:Glycosyl phosphatidyl inositol protein transamidase complex subunit [Thelotrema lepadinum]
MALLLPTILALRRDPRLLYLPPYLSILCVLVGIVWLFLLPLDDYSRRTYISENALLPGQVHTYFSGSEQNIFNAYRHEVVALAEQPQEAISAKLEEILKSSGLKVATQKYKYRAGGNEYGGENVYAVLHAPRGDATEAIVLVAAWKNMEDQLNQSGVALALTLARYFKRWSLWSKDIIFLITPDSKAGPQAWVEAYHDGHSPPDVASLPLKSGALEGAIVVDNPKDHRFEKIHISYDGLNGQLPNLDLFNTAVSVSSGQHGIPAVLQRMWKHDDAYEERLRTIFRSMANQGLGHATGPHSSFIPYHVDAITLSTVGEGWQDDMAFGRVVESLFRSLNNLMEHFHQSFFLYLLMQTNRFVSIGTYLPSAMLVSASFSIMALALWIASGRAPKSNLTQSSKEGSFQKKKIEMEVVKSGGVTAIIPKQELSIQERHLLFPVISILTLHFLGVIPLYIFNNIAQKNFTSALNLFTAVNAVLPLLLSGLSTRLMAPTTQQRLLFKCFSLLLLGMFLATLATVNFSLSFFVGLLSSPLSLVGPLGIPSQSKPSTSSAFSSRTVKKGIENIVLQITSPPVVCFAVCWTTGVSVEHVLMEAAFGWKIWGLWTQVIVWCVWWPAWLAGAVGACPEI